MNSRQLAMRDPALAALVGAIAGASFGSEFAGDFAPDEANFGSEFGSEFGNEFGDDMGGDFGDDMFGADVPAAAIASAIPPAAPTKQQALQLWHGHRMAKAHTLRRELKLHPNKGSSLKLEEFAFPLNPLTNPVFGTASASNMQNQPDVTIRPERIVFNVPALGLYLIAEVKTANVGCVVGGAATMDAAVFAPTSVGMRISCPTLTPSNRLTVVGSWTAFVPAGGFVNGTAYPLSCTALGPAQMAG